MSKEGKEIDPMKGAFVWNLIEALTRQIHPHNEETSRLRLLSLLLQTIRRYQSSSQKVSIPLID